MRPLHDGIERSAPLGPSVLRLSVLLFVLALIPRLLFWYEWNRAGLPALPVVDAATFDKEATGLLDGRWPGPEPFWQAPLYSGFLGGIYRLAGHSWPAARMANALLGAATCVLTWLLARRILARRWAYGVFATCALYGPLIYYEGQLLRETLATFLLLVWLLLLWRALKTERPAWWAASGLLLGLASICRENALILAPAGVALGLWGTLKENDRGPSQAPPAGSTGSRIRRRIGPALFVLGLTAAIAPVTLFNWTRERALIPISSSGGINFYLGNNARSRQTLLIRPGRFWEALVDRPRREGGATTAAARSAFFYREAFDWISAHPLSFAGNLLYKAVGLWTAHEVKRNQDIYEAREGSVLLRPLLWKAGPFGFPFGILGPPALLGLYFAMRTRRPNSAFFPVLAGEEPEGSWASLRYLAYVALAYAAGIVLYFPNARYRAPLVPILAIFAAAGVAGLVRRISGCRQGQWRPLLWPGLVLAASILLVDGGWVRAHEEPADQAFLRATALQEAGRTQEALSELGRATQANPRFGEAWTTLAAIYGINGRHEESIAAARTALAIDTTDAQAWVNLGTTQLDMGDLQSAESNLRRALSIQPDLSDAWLNLGAVHVSRGNTATAEGEFRNALRLDPDLLDARRNLVQQMARSGRFEEGRRLAREGLQRAPREGGLWLSLGNLEGRAGRWPEAAAALGKSVEFLPGNPDAWNNLGLVWIQMGRREEALRAFDRALAIAPSHLQALANRRKLTGG